MKCIECNKRIKKSDETCPRCNKKQRLKGEKFVLKSRFVYTTQIKKFIFITLCLTVFLSMAFYIPEIKEQWLVEGLLFYGSFLFFLLIGFFSKKSDYKNTDYIFYKDSLLIENKKKGNRYLIVYENITKLEHSRKKSGRGHIYIYTYKLDQLKQRISLNYIENSEGEYKRIDKLVNK